LLENVWAVFLLRDVDKNPKFWIIYPADADSLSAYSGVMNPPLKHKN